VVSRKIVLEIGKNRGKTMRRDNKKRFLAGILATAMSVNMLAVNTGVSTFAEPTTENSTNVTTTTEKRTQTTTETNTNKAIETTKESKRESKNQTNETSNWKLFIHEFSYKENSSVKTVSVKKDDTKVDLSNLNLSESQNFKMELGFQSLKNPKDIEVLAGDTLVYTIPDAFLVEDTDSKDILNRKETDFDTKGSTKIGTYKIKDNKVIVTFHENIEKDSLDYILGGIVVPFSIHSDILSKEDTTNVTFALQTGDKKRSLEVVLPKKAEDKEAIVTTEKKTETSKERSTVATEAETKTEAAAKTEETSEAKEGNVVTRFFTSVRSFVSNLFQTKESPTYTYKKYNISVDAKNPQISGVQTSITGNDNEEHYPFHSITLTMPSNIKDVGFKNDEDYKFGFDLVVDSTYLSLYREMISETQGYIDYEKEHGDIDDPLSQYILDEVNPEPITMKLDLGTDFVVPNEEITGILGTTENKLGDYTISKDADGHVYLNVTVVEEVYVSGSGVGGNEATLKFNKTDGSNEDGYDVVWDDTKDAIVVTEHQKEPNPDFGGKDYVIDKSAPESVTTPYVDYTIKVKANKDVGKTLEGMILKDNIPEGMEVSKMTVNGAETALGSTENGVYSYSFDTIAEEATVVITMKLTADYYQKYLESVNEGESWTHKFENKAGLYEKGQSNPDVESDTVSTDMNLTFFEKEGEQNAADGSKLDWTLTVDTTGTSSVDAYLIDTIDASKLSYNMKKGITVHLENGSTESITGLKEIRGEKAFTDLTIADMENLVGTNSGVYYTYNNESIFIVPYKKNWIGQKIKVTYQTSIKDAGGKLENPEASEAYGNKATMVWKNWKYGNGSEIDSFTFNISKDTTPSYHLLNKSAGSYDEKQQIMEWNLNTKSFDIAVDQMVITEKIPKGQELQKDQLTYTKNLDQTKKALPEYNKENPQYPSYEYSDTEDEEGNKILTIHCGDVSKSDYYKFIVKTKITDDNLLSTQGDIKFKNSASIEGWINGKKITNETEAQKVVKNSFIKKSVEANYDTTTHKIQWKVVVNPNHLEISDGVVTDILPKDSTFAGIDKITKITLKDDGTESQEEQLNSWTDTFTNPDDTTPGMVTMDYKNNNDKNTYCIYLSTEMTEEWRQQNHEASDVANKAQLKGKIKGSSIHEVIDGEDKEFVEASAKTPVVNTALEKQNKNLENGLIQWTVAMNVGGTDMSGYTLNENLKEINEPEQGGPFLELNTDLSHFKLYNLNVGKDGTWELGDEITDWNQEGLTDVHENDGFKFKIPDRYGNKPIAIVFQTFGLKNMKGSMITNKVSLTKSNGSETTNVAGSSNTLSEEFSMESYGKLTGIPVIRVYKESSNGQKIKLAGSEFTLTKYALKDGIYEATGNQKVRTTGDTGNLVFTNLSENTLYKVQETNAPEGYAMNDKAYYYNLGGSITGNIQVKDETTTVTVSAADINQKKIETGVPKETVKDTPTGSLTIDKKINFSGVQTESNTLKDATFTLTRTNNDWDDGNTKTEISGENGKVTFSQLDPGTYKLKETQAPEYSNLISGEWAVEVDKNGTVTVTKNGTEISDKTITNSYVDKTLQITKEDQNGTSIKDKKFYIYRRGEDAVSAGQQDMLIDVPATTKTYKAYNITGVSNEVVTDANGRMTLSNLPYGDYMLVEEASASLQPEKNQVAVYIGITGRDANSIVVKENYNVTFTDTTEIEVDDSWTTLGRTNQGTDTYNYTIDNKLKYAFVNLHKTSVENDSSKTSTGGTLDGAEFTIYRDTNGNKILDANETPWTKAKTDTNGNLIKTEDKYNGKFLVYGDYIIKETISLSNHKITDKTYPFTVSDETTGNLGTVWINNTEREDAQVQYVKAGETAPEQTVSFHNQTVRNSISLVKKNKMNESEVITNAAFVIYANDTVNKDKPVAKLAYENGAYEVAEYTGQDKVTKNGDGVAYVYDNKLLQGSYYIVETDPTTGYELNTEHIPFTINEDGSVTGTNVTDNKFATWADNKVTVKNTPITLKMTKVSTLNSATKLSDVKFKMYQKSDLQNPIKFNQTVVGNTTYYEPSTEGSDTLAPTDGTMDFYKLPVGTYTIKETERQQGYEEIDDYTWSFTVTSSGTYENVTSEKGNDFLQLDATSTELSMKNAPNQLIVTKAFQDGSGKPILDETKTATFTLENTGDSSKTYSATTDEKHQAVFTAIPDGNYRMTESGSLSGYENTGTTTIYDVAVTNGNITVTKSSGNGNIYATTNEVVDKLTANVGVVNYQNGFTFTKAFVNSKGEPVAAPVGTSVTFSLEKDSVEVKSKTVTVTGQAKESLNIEFTELEEGTYTLKETSAGSGFALSDDSYQVVVGANHKITITGTDRAIGPATYINDAVTYTNGKNNIVLTKNYADNKRALGEMNVPSFVLYEGTGTSVVQTATRDGDTYTFEGGLADGTYTIREIAPTGYTSAGDITVNVEKGLITMTTQDDQSITNINNGTNATATVDNVPKSLDLSVKKSWEDAGNGTPRPTEVKYTLISTNIVGTLLDVNGTEVEPIRKTGSESGTDETWNGVFANLPEYVGGVKVNYSVQETMTIDDKEVSMDEHGYQVTIEDTSNENEIAITNTENMLTINKTFITNSETSIEPNEPPVFGLYKGETKVYEAKVTGISSNNGKYGGTAKFSQIADGTYILKEISTGDSYLNTTDTYEVIVSKGVITVKDSKGNLLDDTKSTGNKSARTSIGEVKNFAKAKFSFQKKATDGTGLDGASFQLLPVGGKDEDAVLAESKTVENTKGMVTFSDILPGNYTLKETNTVEGYVISTAEVGVSVDQEGKITFTKDGATIEKSSIKDLYVNKKSKISVVKQDETGKAVTGVQLKIVPGENSKLTGDKTEYLWETKEGEEVLENQLIGGGTYTISEVNRKDGYLKAVDITFTYTKDGKITNVSGAKTAKENPTDNVYTVNEGNIIFTVCDPVIQGNIKLTKDLPKSYEAYDDITFDLYQYKGSTEEKDLSKYDKIESNLSLNQTEALLTVSDLPEGYYYFKETATKDDLFLDETPSKVIYIGPDQKGSTVDVSVENERFATNVTLTKTDAGDSKSHIGNTGDPISGTQFTLYKINGENQEKIETTTTQDDGTLKFVIGQKGTYQIVETKAAKGYLIGDHPYMA
jgi:uncharacterized surface anchored protein